MKTACPDTLVDGAMTGSASGSARLPLAATLRPCGRRARRGPVLMIAASGLAVALAACTAVAPADPRDPTIPDNDYEMANAIREARRTLPDFFVVQAAPPANTIGFRLRISASDGVRSEFVWMMPFRRLSDTEFIGTVADQPAYLTQLTRGQELRFARSDIVDWGYTANGHDIGSRTVCVMLNRMPKERGDQLRREHRMSC